MIGKPEWFGRRKYAGWGIFPKKWQGWAYVLAIAAVYLVISQVPLGQEKYRTAAYVVLSVLVVFDILDIMVRMPEDERERLHEALAERNALWTILVVLGCGLVYRAWPVAGNPPYIDPVIAVAIVAGVVVKAISNIYLERKS